MGIRVAVTHDVDRVRKTYQHFTKTIKSLIKGDLKNFAYHFKSFFSKENTYWNFEPLVEIENKYGIKSTFFFLNESLKFNLFSLENWPLSLGRYNTDEEKVSLIIKKLDAENFEIGVHGSFNSFKSSEMLLAEKQKLEKIIGKQIIGVRQHHLNLQDDTWTLQKQVGFKYDSTFGSNDIMGFKDNVFKPFKPFKDYFTVYPMIIMDKTFCYDKNKWENLRETITLAEKNDSILVLNWHLDTFNDLEFPHFKSDFVKIIEILKQNNATFDTLANFYNNEK